MGLGEGFGDGLGLGEGEGDGVAVGEGDGVGDAHELNKGRATIINARQRLPNSTISFLFNLLLQFL